MTVVGERRWGKLSWHWGVKQNLTCLLSLIWMRSLLLSSHSSKICILWAIVQTILTSAASTGHSKVKLGILNLIKAGCQSGQMQLYITIQSCSLFLTNIMINHNSFARMLITRRLPLVVISSFQRIGSKWMADLEPPKIQFQPQTCSGCTTVHLILGRYYLASCHLLIMVTICPMPVPQALQPPNIHSCLQALPLHIIIWGWCHNGVFLVLWVHHKHLLPNRHCKLSNYSLWRCRRNSHKISKFEISSWWWRMCWTVQAWLSRWAEPWTAIYWYLNVGVGRYFPFGKILNPCCLWCRESYWLVCLTLLYIALFYSLQS